jgi:hypothetical protein
MRSDGGRGHASLARLAIATLLVSGTGCIVVLGLRDDYVPDITTSDAAPDALLDAGADALPTVLAFLREPTGRCVACLATKCAGEARACADDPPCAAATECFSRCSPSDGPGCFDRCDLGVGSEARNQYVSCASSQCLDDCRFGAEFGCVGTFSWPPAHADAGVVGVVLQVVKHAQNVPRAGIRITPCAFNGTAIACDDTATRVTDDVGNARLEFKLRSGAGTSALEAWTGFLSVIDPTNDGGDDSLPPTIIRETRPFYETRHDALVAPLAANLDIRAAHVAAMSAQKPGTGSVLGVINDCRAINATQRARGLRITIADSGVSPVYTRSSEYPEPSALESVGGGFYFLNVPAGVQQVIEVTLPDGGFYARARVDVAEGGVTSISVGPQPTNVDRQ